MSHYCCISEICKASRKKRRKAGSQEGRKGGREERREERRKGGRKERKMKEDPGMVHKNMMLFRKIF
jgi:hypothetical protein